MARKHILCAGLIALLQCSAIPAFAQEAACTLTIADTIAGLGTDGQAKNCMANATLHGTLSLPSGKETSLTIKTDATGAAALIIPALQTRLAGKYGLTLQESAAQASFVVLADKPDSHSTLSAGTRALAAGQSATVTVTLLDQYNNPVSSRPVALLSSDPRDSIKAQSRVTDEAGTLSWIFQGAVDGRRTLTAYDLLSASPEASMSMTVGNGTAIGGPSPLLGQVSASNTQGSSNTFGAVTHFEIRMKETTIPVNQQFSFSIAALDANDQVVESYTNTVVISSNDPDAEFPKNGIVAFRPIDLGERVLSLGSRFPTIGDKTIEVHDQQTPSISGKITVKVVGESGQSGAIQILDPKDNTFTNKTSILIQGKAPSFVNLKVMGGTGAGASDAEGVFRIPVSLPPASPTALSRYTLYIASENNQYSSAPINITVDATQPQVQSIAIDPPIGRAGDPATIQVVATDDSGIASVVATINKQPIELKKSASGAFLATFTTPIVANYDVHVDVTDLAGNVTSLLQKWTVGVKGVPKVQGVKAEGQPNQILLSWQPIADAYGVKTYNIYIADAPGNYLYKKEVDATVTSVKVADLPTGKTYLFAITGVNGDGLEGEKSDPVSAAPLGLNLKATPGDGSVMLEWTAAPNLPLSGYILEYGIIPGQYPERRIINGDLTSYTLPDLLNDVTYELKLRPVLLTGKVASDLAAIVHATPTGSGYRPAAPDPVTGVTPPSGDGTTPPPIITNPPPTNPSSGIPSSVLWTLLGISFLAGLLVREHAKRKKQAADFLAMMGKRYSA